MTTGASRAGRTQVTDANAAPSWAAAFSAANACVAGRQHAAQLTDGCLAVGHVIKHVDRQHDVERRVSRPADDPAP
jgi:hypothetical protein